MSTIELRQRLIDKIQKTDNKDLLGEAYRLISSETEDIEVYKLNVDQKTIIHEAQEQIKKGKFLTDEEATRDIDEWLNK